MSRRIVLAIVLLAAAEIGARIALPATVVNPDAARGADQDALCQTATWRTDSEAQRGGAGARATIPSAHPLLLVGGAFTAGAGLRLEERFPEQLAPHALAGGFSEVIAWSADDRVAAIERLLAMPRTAPSVGGPPISVVRHAAGADVVVVELDPTFNGGDATLFSMQSDPLPPFAEFELGPSRLVDAFALLRRRQERDAEESNVFDLISRDGWTARATGRLRHRLDLLTQAVLAHRCDADQERLLRAVLAEMHGLSRLRARREATDRFTSLCNRMRDEQRSFIVLVTGPTLLTLGLVQTALNGGHVVIHAPPFELDPQLRVGGRPSAAVHAQTAESVWTVLTKRGLIAASANAPATVLDRADEIEQRFAQRGGQDESLINLVRLQIGSIISFDRGPLPLSVLRGVAQDGRLDAAQEAEFVLKRPPLAVEMVVRGEMAAGARPSMRMRYFAGERLESVEVAVRALGETVSGSAIERLEWSFEPPPSRGPIDYPSFTLELVMPPQRPPPRLPDASPAAAPSANSCRLREIVLLSPPPADPFPEER
ncbi:MAG: hypothetical protein EXR73_01165 [Myxococcales bacterium]|nr:hypothetical protein [Myxococcales bacterium]